MVSKLAMNERSEYLLIHRETQVLSIISNGLSNGGK
jgi:DNA-binding CsgD family transcriptional regulator